MSAPPFILALLALLALAVVIMVVGGLAVCILESLDTGRPIADADPDEDCED